MSDAPVLNYTREQFSRLNGKIDWMAADIGNCADRLSAIDAEGGYVKLAVAETHSRLDRTDARLDRMERRLDLVDVP